MATAQKPAEDQQDDQNKAPAKTAQKPAEDQQDDQNKAPAKTATKMLVVTKTFQTQGKDKKRVKFIASPEPQDLGEHAAMALEAGVAREPAKDDE